FQLGADFARTLDEHDELKSFRDEFVIGDPDLIYLDGNSLGRLPKLTAERMRAVVEHEWGERVINGWNEGWFDAPRRIGDKIAQLVGARAGEVVVSDSTSINLFKLIVAALRRQSGQTRVVSDVFNFPSDLYIIQGAMELLGNGHELVLVHSDDGITPDLDQLYNSIDERTAVVELSHVVFKSGYLYDMRAVTQRAHEVGAHVVWDLCHSVGALPIALNACEADMAIGCTYKYLNGGPGAPAFLYVREELQDTLNQPIWGWFGQRQPFDFDLRYAPAHGIQHFMTGTPNMLSVSAIEPSVDLLLRAGIERIRCKSEQLSEYLIFLCDQHLASRGFTLGTPREVRSRGSHVSIRHPDAYRIDRAMIERMKVIPDFRTPDNIRLGLVPLYTTFAEVHEAVQRIARIVDDRLYEAFAAERVGVT
ncbi:MAG: kynureninase, partial [Chloroflexi bacterium]|nr:kynureninase [Chloroflexota bacterium]